MKTFIASILLLGTLASHAKAPYIKSELELIEEKTGLDLSVKKDDLELEDQTDAGYFVPYQLSKNDLLKIAAASTVALVFFANDQEIMDFAQENQNEITEKLAILGEGLGSEWSLGAVGAGLILGIVMKDNEIKSVALMSAKAAFVAGLAVAAVKYPVARIRPNEASSPYEREFGNTSFPSGHTAQAFAIATVVAETYRSQNKYIPLLAYSAAALAGWSRVHDKKHWASDVVIGGLIGHLMAKSVMNRKLADKGFIVVPHLDTGDGFAVSFQYAKRKKHKVKCGTDLDENMYYMDAMRDCLQKTFLLHTNT